MTSKLHISDDGPTLDLLRLVDSRMLIQANSGGGKSWLLRLIAEQAAGHVQIIILDPEGEFATLRERHDFLLVGQAGEIPCEVRSAALLARKLLELQASAVVDLYDLKLPERRRFVRLFLESLMHLPKSLWHPLLVMLDEAHIFCPERSAGEAESTAAVIDLMSQGRKRSYCGILATQRLSKLHKDAEAETNNVFIGRSWLDVDQKRAGALLGMDGNARQALRDLEPGQFVAFGPALSTNGVEQFRAAAVQTTHPKAGQRHRLTPPKPSEAVRRIVADLADLPQQAEAEVRDLDGAKKRIVELERLLRGRPTDTKTVEVEKRVEVPVLKPDVLDRLDKIAKYHDHYADKMTAEGERYRAAADELRKTVASFQKTTVPFRPAKQPLPKITVSFQPKAESSQPSTNGYHGPTNRQQRFLDAAATLTTLGVEVTRETVSAWVGVHPRGGSVGTELGALVAAGLIEMERGIIVVTEAGIAAAGTIDPSEAVDRAKSGLSNRQQQFFGLIVASYPAEITREAIAEHFGLHPRGGSLGEDLGRLVGRGLVTGSRGRYRARDFLFAGTK